jgi:adenosylmethionine-8-amino-7-oxononanoate aminotransferase
MTAARPTLVRAEGLHVWDRDGRRYLDGVSGAFCVALGYSRPDLIRAMTDAAERLPFARRAVFENPEAESYGRELVRAVGPPFTRVLLTSSGSEAVEAALKIAYRYQCASGRPDRRGFGFRPGHYHGATLGALAVTGLSPRRGPYEALPGVGPGAPGPQAGAGPPGPQAGPRAAEILETIPAAGLGAPVPEPGFLARVRAECDEAGALWIADEVLTGFGRTGSLFAWQRLGERDADRGVAPDLVVFGKAAGAGYAALGGVLMAQRVARALDAAPESERFAHHQTYGGHPVAAAVGRAVLHALEREQLPAHVRRMEARFREALRGLASHPRVVGINGLGALHGIHFAEDPASARAHPPEARVAERVEEACRARGLLVYAGRGWDGSRGDFVLLAPPLPSGPDAILEAAEALTGAVREVLGG